MAARSRWTSRIFDALRGPVVMTGAEVPGAGPTAGDCLRALIGHLPFCSKNGESSGDDSAQCGQRLPPLGLRQATPQLVETCRPADRWARGGTTPFCRGMV